MAHLPPVFAQDHSPPLMAATFLISWGYFLLWEFVALAQASRSDRSRVFQARRAIAVV
ncbi:MAG: hypothetical protein KME15_04130 [Drouetiella hepatica Uher 2000/2452]|uniref:Uncharacterized protein n=1 Tax=Drouetiella hepatica Uher 2000/2452 TaxID=904376 RepID=A0A951Q7S0_9CYAN|nr:hypothetical protein [Drouetiella hepatica Uher 2000/2452]